MARHSFSIVEYLVSRGSNFRLRYSTGRSSPGSPCASTAPRPTAEASTWTRKRLVKSGLCRTGEENKRVFKVVNAWSQSLFHSTGFLADFVVRSVRGAAIVAKSGMNRRYQPTRPRKDLTCFFVWGRELLLMASSLSTWGRIWPPPRWYPRYCASLPAQSHFRWFRLKPASWIWLRTRCRWQRWLAHVSL